MAKLKLSRLAVLGKILVGNDQEPPRAGMIRFNGQNFEGYDGSTWKALDVQSTSGGGFTEDVGGNKVYLTNSSRDLGIGTNSPTSKLQNTGSTSLGYVTITSSTTAGNYTTYFLDASSGEIVLTLPSASTCPGRVYHIVRAQQYPSAHNCIIACQSGQTINGEPSLALNYNYDRVTVQSNGSNWIVIGT